MKTLLLGLSQVFFICIAYAELPVLKLEEKITVSGLSSGAYMANQFHIAHSKIVNGAALISAGPYYCAENDLMHAFQNCLRNTTSQTDLTRLSSVIASYQDEEIIDTTSNLINDRVWLFHGKEDTTVSNAVNVNLYKQYVSLVDKENIRYHNPPGFSHNLPTVNFGTECDKSETPFLGNCNFDAAGEALSHLYSNKTENAETKPGTLIPISQYRLADEKTKSLSETAFLYVPERCHESLCSLHISFHGCKQNIEFVDKTYAEKSGFNIWADKLDLVVLYPQSIKSSVNPNACWDWWGFTDENYANQNGQQVSAVKRMIDKLMSQK